MALVAKSGAAMAYPAAYVSVAYAMETNRASYSRLATPARASIYKPQMMDTDHLTSMLQYMQFMNEKLKLQIISLRAAIALIIGKHKPEEVVRQHLL